MATDRLTRTTAGDASAAAARLRLGDVTLITATAVQVEPTHAALLHCAALVEFGAVIMLSPEPPAAPHPDVQYHRIPPMDLPGYSRFVVTSLHRYVPTRFCLIVQADGYILNPSCWSDAFLDYDYVGAPWPDVLRGLPLRTPVALGAHRVGNGGFSLRSRRLLERASRIDFDGLRLPLMTEDAVICHYAREQLDGDGLRFAPLEVAARFSIEYPVGIAGHSLGTVFGFHGKHWLRILAT